MLFKTTDVCAIKPKTDESIDETVTDCTATNRVITASLLDLLNVHDYEKGSYPETIFTISNDGAQIKTKHVKFANAHKSAPKKVFLMEYFLSFYATANITNEGFDIVYGADNHMMFYQRSWRSAGGQWVAIW